MLGFGFGGGERTSRRRLLHADRSFQEPIVLRVGGHIRVVDKKKLGSTHLQVQMANFVATQTTLPGISP